MSRGNMSMGELEGMGALILSHGGNCADEADDIERYECLQDAITFFIKTKTLPPQGKPPAVVDTRDFVEPRISEGLRWGIVSHRITLLVKLQPLVMNSEKIL